MVTLTEKIKNFCNDTLQGELLCVVKTGSIAYPLKHAHDLDYIAIYKKRNKNTFLSNENFNFQFNGESVDVWFSEMDTFFDRAYRNIALWTLILASYFPERQLIYGNELPFQLRWDECVDKMLKKAYRVLSTEIKKYLIDGIPLSKCLYHIYVFFYFEKNKKLSLSDEELNMVQRAHDKELTIQEAIQLRAELEQMFFKSR